MNDWNSSRKFYETNLLVKWMMRNPSKQPAFRKNVRDSFVAWMEDRSRTLVPCRLRVQISSEIITINMLKTELIPFACRECYRRSAITQRNLQKLGTNNPRRGFNVSTRVRIQLAGGWMAASAGNTKWTFRKRHCSQRRQCHTQLALPRLFQVHVINACK